MSAKDELIGLTKKDRLRYEGKLDAWKTILDRDPMEAFERAHLAREAACQMAVCDMILNGFKHNATIRGIHKAMLESVITNAEFPTNSTNDMRNGLNITFNSYKAAALRVLNVYAEQEEKEEQQ